eukprot:UC4_evm1s437
MPLWVGLVPYSHLVNSTWGYPTDCSGFVSWALQTDSDLKAYDYSSDTISHRIDIDDLRYGDILTHVFDGDNVFKYCNGHRAQFGHPSGHVFFFDRWNDANHTKFWA